MTASDWWKALLLFLWFYNVSALCVLLVYFYGICRLSESRFKGKTWAFLLPVSLALMGAGMLVYSLADSFAAIYLWYAVWLAAAGVLLVVVVYRSYRLMLGR